MTLTPEQQRAQWARRQRRWRTSNRQRARTAASRNGKARRTDPRKHAIDLANGQRYRDKRKADPERYEAFLVLNRERVKQWRAANPEKKRAQWQRWYRRRKARSS